VIDLSYSAAALSPSRGSISPDPILSANVYCSGRLDEVVHLCLAPFWAEVRSRQEPDICLWIMRYAKGGEHLKVRLHGAQDRSIWMREILASTVESYFSTLAEPEADAPRKGRDLATPIDLEDQISTLHLDRTLVWTTYRRSHISLGYRPYTDDDEYVRRLVRCLGRSTEILLNRLTTDASGRSSHQAVQSILLKILIAGFSILPFDPRERALYLLYHRDCLLRAILKQAGSRGGAEKMRETLDRFRRQMQSMGNGVDRLARTASSLWQSDEAEEWDNDFESWRNALCDLVAYSSTVCGDLAHHVDPFAESPLFPALFKALHGSANQLGLTPLNEAFSHHLLMAATTTDAGQRDRPVQLTPAWLEGLLPQ
jgi:hypothetical protein